MSKEPKKYKPTKRVPPSIKIIPKPKQTRITRKMTEEVFIKVCKELESSVRGLKTICKELGTSSSAFFDLLDLNSNLADHYTRARNRRAEFLFDLHREVVFKRDEDHTPFTGTNVVQRDRLISDTIKWQASKLNSKKYGDKLEVDQTTTERIVIEMDLGKE